MAIAAEFELIAGFGYSPITISGLYRADGWILEENQNGSWVLVDKAYTAMTIGKQHSMKPLPPMPLPFLSIPMLPQHSGCVAKLYHSLVNRT